MAVTPPPGPTDHARSPVTDREAAAMLRVAASLFRLWGLADGEAAVLLGLPVPDLPALEGGRDRPPRARSR